MLHIHFWLLEIKKMEVGECIYTKKMEAEKTSLLN